MRSALSELDGRRRREALRELDRELAEFVYEGLVRLQTDLPAGRTFRRSWDGCVLSYRAGGPGACQRDALGRSRNAFTVAWDAGEITDEEVAEAVRRELGRRVSASARVERWTPVAGGRRSRAAARG